MARSILWGVGAVLSLTGVLLTMPTMAIPRSPLVGETVRADLMGWILVAKPVAGIFFLVIGLFLMYRACLRHDVGEERLPPTVN